MTSLLRLRPTELDWHALEGEVVALDAETAQYLATNQSGATLWQALTEGATRDHLAELLVEAYGIDRRIAEDDVESFLASLREQNLLDEQAG